MPKPLPEQHLQPERNAIQTVHQDTAGHKEQQERREATVVVGPPERQPLEYLSDKEHHRSSSRHLPHKVHSRTTGSEGYRRGRPCSERSGHQQSNSTHRSHTSTALASERNPADGTLAPWCPDDPTRTDVGQGATITKASTDSSHNNGHCSGARDKAEHAQYRSTRTKHWPHPTNTENESAAHKRDNAEPCTQTPVLLRGMINIKSLTKKTTSV